MTDLKSSTAVVAIALIAGILIGVFWDRSQHQVKDLKTTTAVAVETTKQTTTNARTSSAEEGKLVQNGKDIAAAVAHAKGRIDALPNPAIETCVPDLTGKGYIIINAPDPDEYWRAFADGYNSVLDRAAAGEGTAVHPIDGAGIVPAGTSEP